MWTDSPGCQLPPRSVTVAPGKTAPVESITVPPIAPTPWAIAGETEKSKTEKRTRLVDRKRVPLIATLL